MQPTTSLRTTAPSGTDTHHEPGTGAVPCRSTVVLPAGERAPLRLDPVNHDTHAPYRRAGRENTCHTVAGHPRRVPLAASPTATP